MKALSGVCAIILLLSGCVTAPISVEEDGTVRNVSPAALAALPRGISPEFLIKDANGCYGIALEQAEIPSGIPLRNDAGQQVCDA
ncbi:hypothetical protein [Palleronia abyssalis]|uniref:Lipoprotein n=1 Tax=Palleronia abyssalis TaxID=1501240 RepID=A0A2R8BV59_9RHOB|nr:hypothetical protein [Palleronia abyssalis]SPJ24058.1 hypothetical protein PAA8504_01883 [Palleronia abyssalis]